MLLGSARSRQDKGGNVAALSVATCRLYKDEERDSKMELFTH